MLEITLFEIFHDPLLQNHDFRKIFSDRLPHILLLGDALRKVSQEGCKIRRRTERAGQSV